MHHCKCSAWDVGERFKLSAIEKTLVRRMASIYILGRKDCIQNKRRIDMLY